MISIAVQLIQIFCADGSTGPARDRGGTRGPRPRGPENINIDIDKGILQNIDIDIDKAILKNIDIDKVILENIDIDKISNQLEFGILNRAASGH